MTWNESDLDVWPQTIVKSHNNADVHKSSNIKIMWESLVIYGLNKNVIASLIRNQEYSVM